MLLRRITQHVNAQNWFAVVIDLVIVVVGVVIGIEVANWNDVQNNKVGLTTSLERLDKEIAQNISIIEDVLVVFEDGRDDLNKGREALNDCAFSSDGEAALERLLFDFVEDVQPNFASVALDQLSSQARYQDLLSPKFQEDFGFYAARLTEEHEQLTSHYENMWTYHVNYHPSVSAFFGSDSDDYSDWGFTLDKPFAEICVDASFRSRFINTIGFYTSINNRLIEFKAEIELFRDSLDKERESTNGES